mmetsp:Transcript_10100/g.20668  ORF Transcript_10100/g.20668 Transcript_10100/m.20668 type:complete len:205 (+) Transcript_10100:415-1029(+)
MIRTRKTLQGGQRTPTCSNEHDTLAEHEHNQVQSLRGNSTRGSPLQCELAPDMIGIRSKQQFRRNPKLGKARSRKAVCSMTDLLSSQTGGASCGTAPNSSGSTSWVSVLCKEACSPMKHTLTPSAQKMVLDRLVIIMVTKVMPPSAAFCSNPESVLLPNVTVPPSKRTRVSVTIVACRSQTTPYVHRARAYEVPAIHLRASGET